MRRLLITAFLAGAVATSGFAADMAQVGDVVIQQPWARASLGNAPNSAAYMVLEVTGDEADRLIAAATPVATRAELHTHLMEGGVARMRPVEAIEVAPGAPTVLEPGGLHVMLMGLKRKLAEGDTVPLTLTFERAGEITLDLPVEGVTGAMGQGHGGHGAKMTN